MSIIERPAGYTYAQVEAVLRELHSIRQDKAAAFASRLKHLKKLGFPKGVNVGKGRRFAYTAPQLLGLTLAFEFAQLGILPERIVAAFNRHARVLVHSVANATVPMFHPSSSTNSLVATVIVFDPSSLSDLMDRSDGNRLDHSVGDFMFGGPELVANSLEGSFPARRLSAISLDRLLDDAGRALERIYPGGRTDFYKELAVWSDTSGAEEAFIQ